MKGLLITFEGTEGSGKSTQIKLLAERLSAVGRKVCLLREPGGTSIGEEIRHTLKHSPNNQAMTPEAELLLMNASRAQLVREIIRPALNRGDIVICDRFHDSTTVYQGHGRQLDLSAVKSVVDFAVGDTRPALTLLLQVPLEVSEARRKIRESGPGALRDRFEEADRAFFKRVEAGYNELAAQEPQRVRVVDGTRAAETVAKDVWTHVAALLALPAPGR